MIGYTARQRARPSSSVMAARRLGCAGAAQSVHECQGNSAGATITTSVNVMKDFIVNRFLSGKRAEFTKAGNQRESAKKVGTTQTVCIIYNL